MKSEVRQKVDALIANIPNINTPKGEALNDQLRSEISMLITSAEEGREVTEAVMQSLGSRGPKRTDIDVEQLLNEVSESISLSYIARTYFKKGRSWLYQRIKGNIVNGKPAAFTSDELHILSDAFLNLGLKLISVSRKIKQNI